MTDDDGTGDRSKPGNERGEKTHYLISQSGTQLPSDEQTTTTDDMSEEKAMLLVEQLLQQDVFYLDDHTPILHHGPTGRNFESVINAAHFHKGWNAASEE